METTLRPVTSESRTSHLNLLVNGEKVLKEERNKNLPLIVACIAAIVIAAIAIYYEKRLSERQS